MTAAEDRREELEALLWRKVKDPGLVKEILAASDAVATARDQEFYALGRASARREAKRERAAKSPPAEPKPPAVHYAIPGDARGRTACRPSDWVGNGGWLATSDAGAVTCGHCRKALAKDGEAR